MKLDEKPASFCVGKTKTKQFSAVPFISYVPFTALQVLVISFIR